MEHIIFLGSRTCPSRGFLDTLANRSLADGTNAYTDVDHTVYRASAAGSKVFLQCCIFPPLPGALSVPRIPYCVSLESTSEFWKQSTSVDTDFLYVSILFNTSKLSSSQRLVLLLMSRLLFNSAIGLNDCLNFPIVSVHFGFMRLRSPRIFLLPSLGIVVVHQVNVKESIFTATPKKIHGGL